MPILGIAKRRLADKLGSVATRGEGTQNLLCAHLAEAVLIELLGNTLVGSGCLIPPPPSLSRPSPSERLRKLAGRRLLRDLLILRRNVAGVVAVALGTGC